MALEAETPIHISSFGQARGSPADREPALMMEEKA